MYQTFVELLEGTSLDGPQRADASGRGLGVAADGADLMVVFLLVIIMFGSVGALWALFSTVPAKVREGSRLRIVLLCTSYAVCCVGMNVLNKSLSVELKSPALVSMVQMGFSVMILMAQNYRDLLNASRRQLCVWLLIPCLFAAIVCTSFYTYQFISLSLLTVIRNVTPLLTLPLERLMMPPEKQPKVTWQIVSSILVMLLGAVLYAGRVQHISAAGIIFALVNMILALTDRLMQRRLLTTECKELTSSVCAIMNNFWGAMPCTVLALATHQFYDASVQPLHAKWQDFRILLLLILSGFVGTGICVFALECQRAISATSFSVLQNFSKLGVVLVGVLIYHDTINSFGSVVGLLLSFAGAFAYGMAQTSANAKAKAEEKTPLIPKEVKEEGKASP
jgi:drug/metabolite transporter (DMT)-like permease